MRKKIDENNGKQVRSTTGRNVEKFRLQSERSRKNKARHIAANAAQGDPLAGVTRSGREMRMKRAAATLM